MIFFLLDHIPHSLIIALVILVIVLTVVVFYLFQRGRYHRATLEQHFFSLAPVGLAAVCPDGRIMQSNNEFCRMIGLDPEATYQKSFYDYIFPQDQGEIRRLITSVLSRKNKYSSKDVRYITATGEQLWVHLTAILIEYHGYQRILLSSQDITPRKSAEAGLRESEERFQRAFTYAPIGIALTDPKHHFVQVNDKLSEMLGYSSDGFEQKRSFDLLHPDDRRTDKKWNKKLLEGKEQYMHLQQRYLHQDGHIVWIIMSRSLVRDTQNKPLYYISQLQDISERVTFKESLGRSQMLLQETQKLGRIGGWEYNVQTEQAVWTNEMYTIHDVPDSFQPVKDSYLQFYAPEHAKVFSDTVRKAVETATSWDIELPSIKASGETIWVRTTGEAHYDEHNKPIRLIGTLWDITSRKKNEQRQKLMMHELDHRVKNNLSAILSLAEQTIAQSTSLEEFRTAFTGRVTAMARSHEALAAAEWDGLNLSQIAAITLQAFSPETQPRIHLAGSDVLIPPKTATSLSLVLHELATNAIKYGALSNATGHIDLAWYQQSNTVHIAWQEYNGPSVEQPIKKGMGTQLIQGLIEHQLHGQINFNYAPDGLECTIQLPAFDEAEITQLHPSPE